MTEPESMTTTDPTATVKTSETGQRISWGGCLVFGGLTLLLGVLAWGLRQKGLTQVQTGLAPDFELMTFIGETIRLSDFRGQVVVINFWASWCLPCRAEAPLLEQTWRDYRDKGVVFIGVDYLDTEPGALAYIQEFDITYPNGPDLQTRIAQAYRIQGVPETFFVDRKGELHGVFIGPIHHDELLRRIVELIDDEG